MAEDKPRLARLTAVITQLQSKRIVTARDIAEKHNVSIRTVYRDIRTLEKSGIPIVTEEGKGYSIMEGYKLPPVMFTEQEANALITAKQIIALNKDKSLADQYNNAIEKIKSVLKYTQKDKTELLSERLQIRTYIESEKSSDFLIQLQTAITNYNILELNYISLQNKQSNRKIEPFALIHTNENWVLIAFCRLRNDFRTFRLDCIQNIINLNDSFEPHKITLQEYFEQKRKEWENTPDTPLSQSTSKFVLNQKNNNNAKSNN
ncbi:MAG: helix-turn-helix transcriptional regulator [Crocinitomicaceae bacterium]